MTLPIYFKKLLKNQATSKENQELLKKYKANPSNTLRDIIVNKNCLLTLNAVSKGLNKNYNFDDVNSGLIILTSCIDKYDVEKGATFLTYSTGVIKFQIRHAKNAEKHIIKIPKEILSSNSRREKEIPEFINHDLRDLSIQDQRRNLEEEITTKQILTKQIDFINNLENLTELDTIEIFIRDHINKGMTLREMSKMLNVTPQAVSYRYRRIIRKAKELLYNSKGI